MCVIGKDVFHQYRTGALLNRLAYSPEKKKRNATISMQKFIQTITSYNLLNYLIPGTLFVVFADSVTDYSFLQENLIVAPFLYYFIGMIISRIGSLFVEPLLKKIKFLHFADYIAFIRASREDEKVNTLSEQNNQYRTIITMMLLVGLLKLWEIYIGSVLSDSEEFFILCIVLFILFMHSYRKQTGFIVKRVNEYEKEE